MLLESASARPIPVALVLPKAFDHSGIEARPLHHFGQPGVESASQTQCWSFPEMVGFPKWMEHNGTSY